MMLTARDHEKLERAARLMVQRSSYPWLHSALLRTTQAFVIEDAGYKENVIPSTAHVRVNCRGVPRGQKPRDVLAQVRHLLAGRNITVALATPPGTTGAEYLDELDKSWATPPADIDTPLYHAIARSARLTYPGAVFTPALFEVGTSLAPWKKRGTPGYGVYPYVIDYDQLIAMQGNNERIYVDALRQGAQFMYRMFEQFKA